jgi:hypothetical protein
VTKLRAKKYNHLQYLYFDLLEFFCFCNHHYFAFIAYHEDKLNMIHCIHLFLLCTFWTTQSMSCHCNVLLVLMRQTKNMRTFLYVMKGRVRFFTLITISLLWSLCFICNILLFLELCNIVNLEEFPFNYVCVICY